MSHQGEGKVVLGISEFSHNLSVSLDNTNTTKNLKLTEVEQSWQILTTGKTGKSETSTKNDTGKVARNRFVVLHSICRTSGWWSSRPLLHCQPESILHDSRTRMIKGRQKVSIQTENRNHTGWNFPLPWNHRRTGFRASRHFTIQQQGLVWLLHHLKGA